MTLAVLLLAVLALAYANGSNDNIKGVATLLGSGTARYRTALAWGTITTFCGSLTAALLASRLLERFSGKGLVDSAVVGDPRYTGAVALGAGLTVLVATRTGMPISTTHSLIGALVGAGWAAGSTVNYHQLGSGYFAPLLASPMVAIAATAAAYPVFRWGRQRLGVTEQTCLCVGNETVEVVSGLTPVLVARRAQQLTATLGDAVSCERRYEGRLLGLDVAWALDRLHYVSAGAVSYARGLNDTPKIAALLMVAAPLRHGQPLLLAGLVGAAMAVGAVLSARRVAETMSDKITVMNHGQGFTANLFTAVIVLGASRVGMPVSTTHVSCGALFGIGSVTRQGNLAMIAGIAAAWLATLPAGAALGAFCYWLVSMI